jgi:two-component system KDP operon response regulator KdpE
MVRAARILVVDDEPAICSSLTQLLRGCGFEAESAITGAAAVLVSDEHRHDVIVLDLGLPDMDGRTVCRSIRAQSQVPIIVLSARTADAEKIAALDAGADDYVTKPFNPDELLARVRAALRRTVVPDPVAPDRISFGTLAIDFQLHRVYRGGEEIRLTPKQFELLGYFARHPNRVLTHRTILTAVWGDAAADHPEHLWVLIGHLRKKLEADPNRPKYLLSEPWVGYRFAADALEPRQ